MATAQAFAALPDPGVRRAHLALDRRTDDARIHDLSTGKKADLRADVADQILLGPLALYPDCLGIGHLAAMFQPKEALETAII